MNRYINLLSNTPTLNSDQMGGKASHLAKMISKKFPVPPGFCINTCAFDDFLDRDGLRQKIQLKLMGIDRENFDELHKASTAIQGMIMGEKVSRSLITEAEEAADILWNPSNSLKLAVRSSATAEDRPDLSFAGQYDTFLNITSFDDLVLSIKKCWASLWSHRALAYYHKNELNSLEVSMAVVVQKLIEPRVSGAMFTVNPINQNRNEIVIHAAWGIGEGIVSGKITPDEYIISRDDLQIKEKKINRKIIQFSPMKTGIREESVSAENQDKPCLDDNRIRELSELALSLENDFRSPQDIEWGIADEKIYLLQTRPITTLLPIIWGNEATRKLLKDSLVYWSNFNTRETMPYPLTPLSASYFMDLLFPRANKMWFGLTEKSRFYAYAVSLDLIYGRLYWNMNFVLDSPLRESVKDIDHEAWLFFKKLYQQGVLHVPKPKKIIHRILYFLFLFKAMAHVLYNIPWLAGQKGITRRCMKIWDQSLAYEQADLKSKSDEELVRDLIQKNIKFADTGFPLLVVTIFYAMTGMGLLKKLTKNWDDIHFSTLLSGIPGNKTTEGALAMYQLSIMSPAFKQKFQETPLDEIDTLLKCCDEGREFKNKLELFLDAYGHRGPKEFDVGQPRWRDDPGFIYQMVKNYLQLEKEDTTPLQHFKTMKKERERLTRLVRQRLSRSFASRLFPVKKWLFTFALNKAHFYVPQRENNKYYSLKSFSATRRVFMELGERLSAKGYLSAKEDIFFLTIPELERFSQNRGEVKKTVKEIVARRKLEWDRFMKTDPPFIVRSDGKSVDYQTENHQTEGSFLTGAAASAGKIRGIARIIMDPVKGCEFHKGEILVAPFTDPGWTPLFLTAKALVMESGGVFSHGAVVAREYGIPAVVGVTNATKAIKTGDEIIVDGNEGRVILHTE